MTDIIQTLQEMRSPDGSLSLTPVQADVLFRWLNSITTLVKNQNACIEVVRPRLPPVSGDHEARSAEAPSQPDTGDSEKK